MTRRGRQWMVGAGFTAAVVLGSAGVGYSQFTSLSDPEQMPGVRSSVLDWPYVEGLRLDEA